MNDYFELRADKVRKFLIKNYPEIGEVERVLVKVVSLGSTDVSFYMKNLGETWRVIMNVDDFKDAIIDKVSEEEYEENY